MGQIALSGQNWQDRLLRQIGTTHLLIEAYKRRDSLDENLQQEVRSLIGWTVPKEQILEQVPVQDQWYVLAQRTEQQDHLQVQRTWLWGKKSAQFALLLDFAVGNAVLDKTLVVGTIIEAGLVFYPGVNSHRALIKEWMNEVKPIEDFCIRISIRDLFSLYANTLEKMPWTEVMPSFLGPLQIIPEKGNDGTILGWYGIDSDNSQVSLSPQFRLGWHFLAVSGGGPAMLFGEWDGYSFLPLCLHVKGNFYRVMESPVHGLRWVG